MKVQCPNCRTFYKFSGPKTSEKVSKVICPKCQTGFNIKPDSKTKKVTSAEYDANLPWDRKSPAVAEKRTSLKEFEDSHKKTEKESMELQTQPVDLPKLMKIIAVFEMIGGAIGVLEYLIPTWRVIGNFLTNPIIPALHVFFLILYVLCFVAGLLLWKKHTLGISLSRIIQALQIPHFTISGFSYLFTAGVAFTIASSLEGSTTVNFLFGSHAHCTWTQQSMPFSFGLNFIAGFILSYLLKRRKKHSSG